MWTNEQAAFNVMNHYEWESRYGAFNHIAAFYKRRWQAARKSPDRNRRWSPW
jgi:hypothetical protein